MSPQARHLEVGSACLDDDEQRVLNDVGDIQLGESSVLGDTHIIPRPCTDRDGLHGSEHTGYLADPLSPGQLPPNPASYRSVLGKWYQGNDNERGRKKIVGHILSQVGNKDIDVPRLHRLLEFISNLAFGGHVQV